MAAWFRCWKQLGWYVAPQTAELRQGTSVPPVQMLMKPGQVQFRELEGGFVWGAASSLSQHAVLANSTSVDAREGVAL